MFNKFLVVALGLLLLGCADKDQESTQTGSAPTNLSSEEIESLPIVETVCDSDVPNSLEEFVNRADWIVTARLENVEPAFRYNDGGLGAEGQTADKWTEEILLKFDTKDVIKGTQLENFEFPVNGYQTDANQAGSKRLFRMKICGLMVNESNAGQLFALSLTDPGDGTRFPLEILFLNEAGELQDDGRKGTLWSNRIGQNFVDVFSELEDLTSKTPLID